MIRTLALGLLLLAASALPVAAEPALAAAVGSPDDVRQTVLVGPSGQLWEPDGSGTWTRRSAGGVAADVGGATRATGMGIVVAGRATPLYRREGDLWLSLRFGERGRTVVAAGPRAAVAVGRQVFIHSAGKWKRVGATVRPPLALWAGSDTKIYAASDTGVLRLAGGGFVAHAPTPITGFGTGAGAAPWAIATDGGVLDVTTKRLHHPTAADGGAITAQLVTVAADGTVWVLGRTATGAAALAQLRKGAWTVAPSPPLAADDLPVVLAVDRAGSVLVATRAGAVHLGAADGTWKAGVLAEALPAARPGPAPARTR